MRNLVNLLSGIGVAVLLASFAQAETISPREASHHIGEQVTVEGVVSQVSTSSGGTTFVNFGGRYPNHIFYAVLFRKRAHQFPNLHALEGRPVAISGMIELYKGKSQIILITPSQIKLR